MVNIKISDVHVDEKSNKGVGFGIPNEFYWHIDIDTHR